MDLLINGNFIEYSINKEQDNCTIIDSFYIHDKETKVQFIKMLIHNYEKFNKRSVNSYYREWKAHNILYKLGFAKERTKNVDLNINEYWWRRLGYFFISLLKE